MTSMATPSTPVEVPDAPPIPGLTFRTGRMPDDWAPLA